METLQWGRRLISVIILLSLAGAVTGMAAGGAPAAGQGFAFSPLPTPLQTLRPTITLPTFTPTPTPTGGTLTFVTPTHTPTPTPTGGTLTFVTPTHTPTPTPTGGTLTFVTPTHTPIPIPIPTGGTLTIPTPTDAPSTPRPTLTPTLVPLPPGGFYYTVRPGDNLFRIALRFGTTIQAIVRANGIVNPRIIHVGQVLWIPSGSTGPVNPTIYIVQRGDTLYSIARRFGTTVQVLAAVNGIRNPRLIYAGQRLIIPGSGTPGPAPPSPREYVVCPGDTLWAIALRFGTTPWAIAVANDLRNPNLIYPGQRLIIP